ncbi:MAG: hypothetical protein M1839_002828 [Geoglossum umbratile]|nr:MAG: hypothetical protein M1839_002828 [Geoglossum umbratile]
MTTIKEGDALKLLQAFVSKSNINSDDQHLQNVANAAPEAQKKWREWWTKFGSSRSLFDPNEYFDGFLKLALFDIHIMVGESFLMPHSRPYPTSPNVAHAEPTDDSGSMYEGDRIEQLKKQLKAILKVDVMFDSVSSEKLTEGVQVYFVNNATGKLVRKENEVEGFVDGIAFGGGTPLGTQLERKILGKLLGSPSAKPALVHIITDGQPNGESENKLPNVIKKYKRQLNTGIVFSIVQVGNDPGAEALLVKLRDDPEVPIHVTSDDLGVENKNLKHVQLTVRDQALRSLVGAIDSVIAEDDDEDG